MQKSTLNCKEPNFFLTNIRDNLLKMQAKKFSFFFCKKYFSHYLLPFELDL